MTVVMMRLTRAPLFKQSRTIECDGYYEMLQHAAGRRYGLPILNIGGGKVQTSSI